MNTMPAILDVYAKALKRYPIHYQIRILSSFRYLTFTINGFSCDIGTQVQLSSIENDTYSKYYFGAKAFKDHEQITMRLPNDINLVDRSLEAFLRELE